MFLTFISLTICSSCIVGSLYGSSSCVVCTSHMSSAFSMCVYCVSTPVLSNAFVISAPIFVLFSASMLLFGGVLPTHVLPTHALPTHVLPTHVLPTPVLTPVISGLLCSSFSQGFLSSITFPFLSVNKIPLCFFAGSCQPVYCVYDFIWHRKGCPVILCDPSSRIFIEEIMCSLVIACRPEGYCTCSMRCH